ncbi:hypothetical protein CQY22_017075 [Mycolicibacterium brumae]|uniref:Secreted protein n=1 Tax=Mycolicibacterium brumae TaxID=85968 RepID=A0A2G5P4T8_9MYCO|nr:hypothetical protein CQY22_017075 [Mycolicibacterium brumae]RWA18106.1 hypothetical protein MBRU_17925 [Mycolicibacterium brumae DSM 44177]
MWGKLAGGLAATSVLGAVFAGPAVADDPITPDEWGMDDGIGVGPRVAGTPCLASESHQWASPVDGGRFALWCPPPAFVWVPVG